MQKRPAAANAMDPRFMGRAGRELMEKENKGQRQVHAFARHIRVASRGRIQGERRRCNRGQQLITVNIPGTGDGNCSLVGGA